MMRLNTSKKIAFRDVDGDGEDEILVYFTILNQHQYTVLEVIKLDENTYSRLLVVRGENRSGNIEFFDFISDGISEVYGPSWGGTGELWVRRDFESNYQNVLPLSNESAFYSGLDNGLESALREVWLMSTEDTSSQ